MDAAQAHAILTERVRALGADLPGVTFGYIGNLDRLVGDDRSWRVFLPHPGRVGESFRDCVHLGGTADLPRAVAEWPRHEATARRLYAAEPRR